MDSKDELIVSVEASVERRDETMILTWGYVCKAGIANRRLGSAV